MRLKTSEHQVLAWTGFVRVTHWLVAIIVLVNFFNETGFWHRFIGYFCLTVVVSRIVYGLWFSKVASSRLYIPTMAGIKLHLIDMATQQALPHDGHNPLGQLAVYFMWFLILLLGFTGWLSRTDRYWGEDWPVTLHQGLSYTLMAMVALHLTAVFIVSRRSRQHLIKQMIDGKKHHHQQE